MKRTDDAGMVAWVQRHRRTLVITGAGVVAAAIILAAHRALSSAAETQMEAQALSEMLRTGQGGFLWHRRAIVAASFCAAACMVLIALYQMGVIRHLPDLPWRVFDADRVDAAPEAYSRMNLPIPDAFQGLISYAITAALAAIGGMNRHERWWWLPLLLMLKVLIDSVQAARLSWEQWDQHRAFCIWCLIAAAAAFATVPLAMPESWAAIRRLF